MRSKLFICLACFFICELCISQTKFAIAIGGVFDDCGNSVIQTSDSCLFVIGSTGGFSPVTIKSDIFILKFNLKRTVEYSKTLGGTDWDGGSSVIQTFDDGFAIVGATRSFGAGRNDLFFVKLDSSCSVEWARAVGGTSDDHGSSVIQTTDSGFAVVGATASFGAGRNDLFIVKFNSSGSIEWARAVGGAGNDYGNSVIQTSDGGFIIIGVTENFGAGRKDLLLIKFSPSGLMEWARTIGGSKNDRGSSIIKTSDGGFAVVGFTSSFGADWVDDLFLIKFSSSDSLQWARTVEGIAGHYGNYGSSIIQTLDSSFIVTGYTGSFGAGGFDLFLVKFSPSDSLEWASAVGGIADDYGSSLIQTSDSNFIVVGRTESFGAGRNDLFLVKFDTNGNTCLGGKVTPTVRTISPTIMDVTPIVTVVTPAIANVIPTITDVIPTITDICTGDVTEIINQNNFKIIVMPNPFNSSVTINIPSGARIVIYDIRGNIVYNGIKSSGERTLIWKPGQSIINGVYLIKAIFRGKIITKRVVLIR